MTHARHARKRVYSKTDKNLLRALVIIVAGVIGWSIWFTWFHGAAPPVITSHGMPLFTHPDNPTAPIAGAGVVVGAVAAGVKKIVGKIAVKHAVVHHTAIKHYTVKAGDTLWSIAGKTLGNPLKWHQLYMLNHHLIGMDPNKIVAGQSLLL